MDTNQAKKFEMFLRQCCFGDSEEYGRVKRFNIKHVLKDNKLGGDVGSVIVPSDVTTDGISELAQEIEDKCLADSEGIGEAQRYQVSPLYSNVSAPNARFIIRIENTSSEALAIPTNSEDVQAHLMRHNENIMRLNVGMPGTMMQQAQRLITRQQDHIETLTEKIYQQMDDRLKIYAMMEEMLSRRLEREHEAEIQKSKLETINEVGGKVIALLPAIVNRIGGKKILPETTTPEGMAIRDFMKTVTKEQMGVLMNTLTPNQSMTILALYQQFQQEEEVSKAKKSAEESSKK